MKDEAEPKLILDRALPLAQVGTTLADRVVLDVLDREIDEAFITRLEELAGRRPGPLRTVLRVGLADGNLVCVDAQDVRLSPDGETISALETIVGEGGVRLGGNWPPARRPRRGGGGR